MLTTKHLTTLCPRLSPGKAEYYAQTLNVVFKETQITTVTRAAAFLGQVCVESYDFAYMREIWGKTPTTQQAKYERTMSSAWPPTSTDTVNGLAYTLGNSEPGDGYLFRGWGPLQITGRSNTLKASIDMFGDGRLVLKTELLDDPAIGLRGAAWYWTKHRLNDKADEMAYEKVTRAVNGGLTHHAKRLMYYYRALEVLGKDTFIL